MVSVDPFKKYLNLEGVRVSYKKKDDTIHITATDPDVQASGFHLALSRGTQTEETLRDLLLEHEVIRVEKKEPVLDPKAPALSALVERMISEREQAHADKDWGRADRIRDELERAGILLTETDGQVDWLLKPSLVTDAPSQSGDTQAAPTKRQGGARIFTVTSSAGGVGSTALAILLAAALAHPKGNENGQAKRVCLIDLDLRDGTIGFMLGKVGPTALNMYLNPDKSARSLEQSLVYDPNLGIHTLLVPKRARAADFLTPEFYLEILDTLSGMFDVIILDTSDEADDPLLPAMYDRSDAICFVTNLSIGSVYGMTRWMHEATGAVKEGGLGVDNGKIGVIVNQTLQGVGVDQELLQKAALNAKLIGAVPLDPKIIATMNTNTMVDLLDADSKIAEPVYAIARKLSK